MAEIVSLPESPKHTSIHDLLPFTVVDYPGHVACTLFTAGCNLRCPYCHNADLLTPTTPPTIDETTFFQFLEKREGLLTGVCITGGEPTLHDLTPLLTQIKKKGYDIKLDTNGTQPQRWIPWVEKGLVDYIAMDIKAPLESYGRMGATPSDMKGIAQSVQYLLAHPDLSYEFRTTIHPNWLSETDIDRIGEWLSGARRLALQPYVPSPKVLDPTACEGPGYSEQDLLGLKERLDPFIGEVVTRKI